MDRDPALDRHLLEVAARAAGTNGDRGLGAFADSRAHPGPVILKTVAGPRDFDREVREEIADGVNYCRWSVQEIHARVLAGDADVMDRYERHMRTLSLLVAAWHALHTGSV